MVRQKPASCEGCPAFKIGKGFVPPTTNPNANILLIGSGPSSDEYLDGTPGTGIVGRKIDYWLSRAKIDKGKVALAHVVQCQLPYVKGAPREPTKGEAQYCMDAHWGSWLKTHLARGAIVVPMGIGAIKALIGPKATTRDVGNLFNFEDTDIPVLPIQSPHYILGGNWNEESAQIAFLRYALDISRALDNGEDPFRERPDFSKPPQGIQIVETTLSGLEYFRTRVGTGQIVVDIETAGDHIRLVGLYHMATGCYLGFPIRTIRGGVAWGSDLPIAIQWLYELLSDPTVGKCFHNGQAFDIPMLERNGFIVEGYEFDTMLAQHVASPGLPKGLEHLSKVYLRAGGWKSLVRTDETGGEGK